MTDIDLAFLARHPLPTPDAGGDKEDRGRVLIVGGGARVPGALLLAGVAALRAGAGKLQIATAEEAAVALAVAVPEALVVPLPASRHGELTGRGVSKGLATDLERADAVLVGPGMIDGNAREMLDALLPHLGDRTVLVVDGAAAVALGEDRSLLHHRAGRVIVTPHAGEMASLLAIDKAEVEREPALIAQRAARELGAVVALKGARTHVAEPDGALYVLEGACPGLGTSGSGDVLAGVVAGLAARGATALAATAWGVWAHASAGRILSDRMAPIGFLAREIAAEIPALVARSTRG